MKLTSRKSDTTWTGQADRPFEASKAMGNARLSYMTLPPSTIRVHVRPRYIWQSLLVCALFQAVGLMLFAAGIIYFPWNGTLTGLDPFHLLFVIALCFAIGPLIWLAQRVGWSDTLTLDGERGAVEVSRRRGFLWSRSSLHSAARPITFEPGPTAPSLAPSAQVSTAENDNAELPLVARAVRMSGHDFTIVLAPGVEGDAAHSLAVQLASLIQRTWGDGA